MDAARDDDVWTLVQGALARDATAVRKLIALLSPVIHARVARALLRSATARQQGRDLRQHVEDFTQETFALLFANDARVLGSWDPERGLSLRNFVGLVAEHKVASILRSGRRSPWTEEPTEAEELDGPVSDVTDVRVHSREMLALLLERLRAELSPRGLRLFELLVVEERSAEDVGAMLEMSADAVYGWRSRFGKVVRRLADEIAQGNDDGAADPMAERRKPLRQEKGAR